MGKKILQYWIYLAVCTFTLQVSIFVFQPSKVHAADKPNIILINTDDMGWGDLCKNYPNSASCQKFSCDTSIYGAQCTKDSDCATTQTLVGCVKSNTPKLDSLASAGVTLTNFYTPTPLCTPSRAALLTGRDHRRMNINGPVTSTTGYLPATEKTLAQVLKAVGYNTAIVGKWNLGWSNDANVKRNSWDFGFDYNYTLPNGVHWPFGGFCLLEKNLSGAVTPYYLDHQLGGSDEHGDICPGTANTAFWTFTMNKSLTEHLSEKAITYINILESKKEPFFLYLAHLAPHTPLDIHVPYDVAAPYILKPDPDKSICEKAPYNCAKTDLFCVAKCQINEIYDDVIREIDLKGVSPVLARICGDANNDGECEGPLYQNTIVLFTSDNGPYRGDQAELPSLGSTGGMRGAKKFTYEGGVRVPFIAQWPAGSWTGNNAHTLGQLADMRDVFPTLVRVALKDSGLCPAGCSCVNNGEYANDTGRIQFTGTDGVSYDIFIDGKDISDVLSTGDANTTQKNVQISWFGNYSICLPGDGICTTTEDSHPFAIRSNVTNNVPADIANYKLYLLGDKLPTGNASTASDVRQPVELYNLSYNLSEVESGNLCIVTNKTTGTRTNECLNCTITNGTISCPALPIKNNIKTIVEYLWNRANLYQNNVKNNTCQGALCTNPVCPQ